MRSGEVKRRTNETDIAVRLVLDGTGKAEIATGVGFFDHMLDLFARHALIDLAVSVTGDTHIDDHHSVEDAGIALGEALFRTTATPVCSACHSIAPGVNLAGPTLAGLAARAKQVIASPDYKGKAKDVEGFIRDAGF